MRIKKTVSILYKEGTLWFLQQSLWISCKHSGLFLERIMDKDVMMMMITKLHTSCHVNSFLKF